ncbi:hypothetical protein LWF15_08960 [Kineosporia rhizophila]|uniref:glycoside hydrolase family 26 protein n=1 Tax=Kineosporia rhizophila TaxID=84633 RepID=UPI001E324019|nr:hypothetical protein [Kineosporia rhizophila]
MSSKRVFSLVALLLVVVVAVGAGVYVVLRPTEAEPTSAPITSEPAPTATGVEKGVKVGVFRSTSPEDVQEFGDWLGRDVDYVVDFSLRSTWKEIANPYDQLKAWQKHDYRIVYGLAMLPEAKHLKVSLAAGADGDYNRYYRRLARNLVEYGQEDAILRLGWEFNLGAWRWHPDDREDFIGYWRQVVKTMRAVPGAENLQFDWNVSSGGNNYNSAVFYPGDAYVDYVGADVYDISWADGTYPYPADCDADCRLQHQKKAWDDVYNAQFGLKHWSRFAAEHGKPLTLPEWGLWDRTVTDGHGGGDNPYFIERMHEFIDDPLNNVAYQAYFQFDVGDNGNHMLTDMPQSQDRFLELFG